MYFRDAKSSRAVELANCYTVGVPHSSVVRASYRYLEGSGLDSCGRNRIRESNSFKRVMIALPWTTFDVFLSIFDNVDEFCVK